MCAKLQQIRSEWVNMYIDVHFCEPIFKRRRFVHVLSLSSPVYQVEVLCFAVICICDLAQPAELPQ